MFYLIVHINIQIVKYNIAVNKIHISLFPNFISTPAAHIMHSGCCLFSIYRGSKSKQGRIVHIRGGQFGRTGEIVVIDHHIVAAALQVERHGKRAVRFERNFKLFLIDAHDDGGRAFMDADLARDEQLTRADTPAAENHVAPRIITAVRRVFAGERIGFHCAFPDQVGVGCDLAAAERRCRFVEPGIDGTAGNGGTGGERKQQNTGQKKSH